MSISAPETETTRLLTREFLILGSATMLAFFGMGAVNPLLPLYVVDELGGTEATAGVVMGAFAVSALTTRGWFGRHGDRRGSRRILAMGCVLGAVAMALLVVSVNVPIAIVARLVMGAGQAAIMTGSTVLAIDLAPEDRRGEAASYILVAFHLGMGVGPLIGEQLLDLSSYGVVWGALAVAYLAGAGVAGLLPHRPGDADAPPSPLLNPAGMAPGVVAAAAMTAMVAFTTFVPLYGREIGMGSVGSVFMTVSVTIVVVRVLFGRLPDRLGPVRGSDMALGLTLVGVVVLAAWSSVAGVFVAAVTLAAGMALLTPALIPVAVRDAGPNRRSSAMATFTMFMDFSVAVTAPLVGLLASGVGYRTSFLATGLLTLVGLVLVHAVLAPRWHAGETHEHSDIARKFPPPPILR